MQTETPEPALLEVALMMREVHERMLDAALGHSQTAGTCLYSCLLLRETIQRFTSFECRVRGGDGSSSGYRDQSGRMHGHYWVEAHGGTQHYVVDITADQFGGSRVTLLELAASLERYIPGDQAEIDDHVRQCQHDMACANNS